MMKSKISIAIPIHLRGRSENESYRKAITHYAKLGYPIHVCGSEGNRSMNFCQPIIDKYPNVKYIEVAQICTDVRRNRKRMIREKFNNSILTLPDSDWYCMVGADDIASKDFFDELETIIPTKSTMSGVSMKNPFYIVHLSSKNKYRILINYGEQMDLQPGVNAFSRQLKEKYKGIFYPGPHCETSSEIFFRKEKILPLPGYVIMLKGEKETVITPIERILARHKTIPITDDEEKMLSEISGR